MKTKPLDTTTLEAPFCGSVNHVIEKQIDISSYDRDAKAWADLMLTWANTTYSSDCLTKISQFACEKKFLNCNEKDSKYITCQNLCQDVVNCMMNSDPPISCNMECSRAYRFSINHVLLFMAILFIY